MRKKLISIFGAWTLISGLAATACAQQLYIRDMQARYPTGKSTDTYCEMGYSYSDNNVSFVTQVSGSGVNPYDWSAKIEREQPRIVGGVNVYPGGCLKLCAEIVCVSSTGAFGVDELTFEIFKFGAGSNPLDPASTPPIRTISLYNVGTCPGSYPNEALVGNYCAAFDASYNLNGIFGKTNGQFGYRAKVKTNQVSLSAGNISIEQTSAYPGQNQLPIQVDVVNVHTVRSSPTVVGRITGVSAQPYNILYRLSKDASATITIFSAEDDNFDTPVRHIMNDVPRVGEGTPDGTLTNGDFWDGRNNTGNLMPSGVYVAFINARAYDYFGLDNAYGATTYISLDPLQITDVAIKPLGASATDMATISYLLTEAATAYVDIYPSGTVFDTVNTSSAPLIGGKNLCDGGADDVCLRHFSEQKDRRTTVITYWDGRDKAGHPVCDGSYTYAIYAALPSAAASGGAVWTTKTMVGTVPVNRGNVVALMSFSETVIGSSPSVAGLDPFYFRYTPSRDAYVSMNIRDMSNNIVRHVTTREVRFANFSNREIWDGKKDDGTYVPNGTYMAELVTEDPFQCSALKTSTVTASPIGVSMFRIVDLKSTPLLGGTSDVATISFELSQPMYMELNVYKTSVTVNPYQIWTPGSNPSLAGLPADPVYNVQGLRPGRYKITEYWDGRDSSGLLVPDGRYPFVLVAHTTSPVVSAQTMYAIDEAYGYVDISRGQIIFTSFNVTPSLPTMYNASDTIKLPPYEVSYSVTRQSSVTVQVLSLEMPPRVMANVIAGQVRDGDILYSDFWDGKDDAGNFVDGGAYNVRVTAQDISSQMASRATVQLTIDVYPLRIYDVSITPLTMDYPAIVSYQVSEPMKVVTKIFKPGTSFSAYGVASPPESTSLLKRIIGVRPARTKIEEYWDGTDMTLSKVPDGNYVFKIYASTVTGAISTLDGSVATGTLLADDIVTSNIPVIKGGSADLCGDFEHDTFFAPNPYTGEAGWFRIPLLMNGRVTVKIYNLAGDLVHKKDYGVRGAGDNIDGGGKCAVNHTDPACWPKVNTYGRTVAPGVYFAVVRFEATEGTRDVCQVVKKILAP
ncbi:MAG TPA: hypothetical protein DCS63_06640 [Elusimicrobia bacterium]|nr:hypothetical protein [Elusimicrobiota bacterium]